MAEWTGEKVDKSQINYGQQYVDGDGLSADDFNNIVNNTLYAIKIVESSSKNIKIQIDDNIYNTDFFISYLNNYNINLTDFKNQTVCFESYSGTDYYDYFVFLTNYDNEAILLCDEGVFNIGYSSSGYKKSNIVQKVTGDLANLQNGIMDKDNLVSAINYTYNATLFNSSNIDTINKEKGNLFGLQTNDKTNLVNAINEINTISKENTNDINKLGLSLTDLKEALYGYVLDTNDVNIDNIIPSTTNSYNLVDNVRGLVKEVKGNTLKVSGNNLISYVPTTLNSTNSVGDTIATLTANGSVININRTASSGSNTQNNTIQLSKSLSANTQYTFKLFTQFADTENFGIIFMNSSGQTLFQLNNSTNKQTYTPSSDITQVRVLTTSGTYTKDIKIMCVEGSNEPSEFESADSVLKSVEYEGLKVSGRNLFDETTHIYKDRIAYSGTSLTYWTGYNGIESYIKVKPNTQYTYSNSLGITLYNVVYYDTNKNVLSNTNNTNTFTTPTNCAYIRLCYNNSNLPIWTMLNKGSTALPYTPYKEPITLLPFTTTLRGVGTAKDKIVISENKNGLYTATKISNMGSYTFTGNETITKQENSNYTLGYVYFVQCGINNKLLSNETEIPNFITPNFKNVASTFNMPNGVITTSFSKSGRLVFGFDGTETELTNELRGKELIYETTTPTQDVLSTTLTESEVMTILELGGSIDIINSNSEFVNGSTTMEMVYKLINTTTSEVATNEITE